MFHDGGLIALRNAIGAEPAPFDVRRKNRKNIPFKLARRKARPGVEGISGRVRTPVHPNRSRPFTDLAVHLNGDQPLCDRFALLPDAIVSRRHVKVRRDVAVTLLLPHGHAGGVPAQAIEAGRLVEGNASIVGEHAGGRAQVGILAPARHPISRKIDAGGRRRGGLAKSRGGQQHNGKRDGGTPDSFHPGSFRLYIILRAMKLGKE
jgi:hypothetical protein